MPDQPRPVWLTKAHRDLMTQVLIYLPNHHGDQVREIVRAWDAAPADPTAENVARMFHENYERLAPLYNYQTRKASAVPWKDVPHENRALMVETCGAVLRALGMPDA